MYMIQPALLLSSPLNSQLIYHPHCPRINPHAISISTLPREEEEEEEETRPGKVVMVSWEPPPFLSFKLNIDGCSKGNPGESGSGGILRDFAGRFVAGFSYKIGFQHAIAAELWALYQGLQMSRNVINPNTKLWIETDSVEVLSVTLGHYSRDYRYADLVESCQEIIKSFKNVEIRHIYREANRAADFLANQSLLHDVGIKIWSQPNAELHKLMCEDRMGLATPRLCKGLCKPKFYA